MKVQIRYRSNGRGWVKPIFMAPLSGEYVIIVDGVRYRCTLYRYTLTVRVKGGIYTYDVSTTDCRRCGLLCRHLAERRPKTAEVYRPLNLRRGNTPLG
jgi:hypothetical protein